MKNYVKNYKRKKKIFNRNLANEVVLVAWFSFSLKCYTSITKNNVFIASPLVQCHKYIFFCNKSVYEIFILLQISSSKDTQFIPNQHQWHCSLKIKIQNKTFFISMNLLPSSVQCAMKLLKVIYGSKHSCNTLFL